MENFTPPSSSSSYSTSSTIMNTPLVSANEPSLPSDSHFYYPSSQLMPPCQIPYACPNDQTGHSFSHPSYPFSLLQNGNEFGAQADLPYNGLRKEPGFLDSQRTKVARIKRKLARQRSLSLNKNTSSSSSSSGLSSNSTELVLRRSMVYRSDSDSQNRSSIAKRDLYQFCTPDNKKLRVLLNKELKNSDVGSLGRIVLPKREAEGNLPSLSDKEGIQIVMRDAYSNISWTFKYKFWSNNKSRMYVLENTGDFVKQNGLENGDFLSIYEDESKNLAEKPTGESSNAAQHNQSFNQLSMSPFDYQIREEEEEASLAVLIEQLNHKEQQFDANNLLSFPALENLGNNCDASASYDHEMNLDDCYGGLGVLPDVNRYRF